MTESIDLPSMLSKRPTVFSSLWRRRWDSYPRRSVDRDSIDDFLFVSLECLPFIFRICAAFCIRKKNVRQKVPPKNGDRWGRVIRTKREKNVYTSFCFPLLARHATTDPFAQDIAVHLGFITGAFLAKTIGREISRKSLRK